MTFDGYDVRDDPSQFAQPDRYRLAGHVPSAIHVANNIRYGKPDATDEEVIEAG